MTSAWTVVIISAFTDFVITAATGAIAVLTAVLVEPAHLTIQPLLFIAPVLGGLVAASRTIQQALKGDQFKPRPEDNETVIATITASDTKTAKKPKGGS